MQNSQKPKPVLFFSNYCQYSKDIIGLIQRSNLVNAFVPFCVDGRINKLPIEVKSVPTINFLDKYYTDDELDSFIATLKYDLTANPYDSFSLNDKGFSACFSFIDDNVSESINGGFMPLRQMNITDKLPDIPNEIDIANTKLSSLQISHLENYRDEEIRTILAEQQPIS